MALYTSNPEFLQVNFGSEDATEPFSIDVTTSKPTSIHQTVSGVRYLGKPGMSKTADESQIMEKYHGEVRKLDCTPSD